MADWSSRAQQTQNETQTFELNWQNEANDKMELNKDQALATTSYTPLTSSGRNRLSSFSNSKFIEQGEIGLLSPNLNENDYHTVIQSMLSYIKIPLDEPLVVSF